MFVEGVVGTSLAMLVKRLCRVHLVKGDQRVPEDNLERMLLTEMKGHLGQK